jgi:uncharacterized protein (DUF488 family)
MSQQPTNSPGTQITIFTIGFAKKRAEEFFTRLQKAGVRRLIDVRLNNVSQLAGYTKMKDLQYFLRVIGDIDYRHLPDLAPTKDILDAFKKKGEMDWAEYERRFTALMDTRRPEDHHTPEEFDQACLLCSEPSPENCHRRLVVERLRKKWGNVVIKHL